MGILGQKQKPKKVVKPIMMKTTNCQIEEGQMTNLKKCVQMLPLYGIISKKYPKTFLIPWPPK